MVVLQLTTDLLPAFIRSEPFHSQSTRNYKRLNEHFEGITEVALVPDEEHRLPSGDLVGERPGVVVTPERGRGDEPREIGVDQVKRTGDVIGCFLGVSLLCAFPDGIGMAG